MSLENSLSIKPSEQSTTERRREMWESALFAATFGAAGYTLISLLSGAEESQFSTSESLKVAAIFGTGMLLPYKIQDAYRYLRTRYLRTRKDISIKNLQR